MDKLFDENNLPKRLSFDYLDMSLEARDSPGSSKRRLSTELVNSKRWKEDDSFRGDDSAQLGGMSPWQSRRLKVDLIEAKTRITQLKKEIEHQHLLKANMETMYMGKVDGLTKQVDHSTKKIGDLEKHLTVLRKREALAKEDMVRARNQTTAAKQQYDEQLNELRKTNSNLEQSLQSITSDLNNEIGRLSRELNAATQNFVLASEEVETMRQLNKSLQDKIARVSSLEQELEEEKQKSNAADLKIKELEFEIGSYGEWKQMSQSHINRLSGIPDMESEIERLKTALKNTNDAVGNKLLLEEQVFDMKSRLERFEKQNLDAVQLKVKAEQLEKELRDWKQIGIDHCPPKTVVNALSLRSRIEQILQNNLIMSNEISSDNNEKSSMAESVQSLKHKITTHEKVNADLNNKLRDHQNMIQRIRKKLILVGKERDCYKQVMEHYEKEVTISGPLSANNPESQLRMRLEIVEKTLAEYKELCANLESDLQQKTMGTDATIPALSNPEQFERLRKELDEVRSENERLKRRRDELERKLEYLSLTLNDKKMVEPDRLKVVHFRMNPADVAYEDHKNVMEKLQAEVERLKRKIRKMETEEAERTTASGFNETNVMTENIMELNQLKNQIKSLESKNQHLKEVYKTASLEYRDVVYFLFGYRVDRVGNSSYQISSVFAENKDDYLTFRLTDSGELNMLETNYSLSLPEMMAHLAKHKSLPVFLSTLTLELFSRVTKV